MFLLPSISFHKFNRLYYTILLKPFLCSDMCVVPNENYVTMMHVLHNFEENVIPLRVH